MTRWQYAIRESSLSGPARGVAFTLSLRMDRDSLECMPGIERVARESGWSESTTRKAIHELRDRGYLWVSYRGAGFGQQSNLYRGVFPRWYKRAPVEPRNEAGF